MAEFTGLMAYTNIRSFILDQDRSATKNALSDLSSAIGSRSNWTVSAYDPSKSYSVISSSEGTPNFKFTQSANLGGTLELPNNKYTIKLDSSNSSISLLASYTDKVNQITGFQTVNTTRLEEFSYKNLNGAGSTDDITASASRTSNYISSELYENKTDLISVTETIGKYSQNYQDSRYSLSTSNEDTSLFEDYRSTNNQYSSYTSTGYYKFKDLEKGFSLTTNHKSNTYENLNSYVSQKRSDSTAISNLDLQTTDFVLKTFKNQTINIYNGVNDDNLWKTLNFGTNAGENYSEVADSLSYGFIEVIKKFDNLVLLKNTGVRFDAGAGNDSVTGSVGNDLIDAGGGDDTVAAGTGDDTIFWSSGKDTIDGGNSNAGSGDILDFSEWAYPLNLSVTGTASNFTVTDQNSSSSANVKNVEFVRINGEIISTARFVTPDDRYVNALDALTVEFDTRNIPSVAGIAAMTGSAAADLVDISDVTTQTWLEERIFDPNAKSQNLTFSNFDKSKITVTSSLDTSKGYDRKGSVSLISGDGSIKYTGAYATKETVDPSTSIVSSSKLKSFTFSDTRGTVDKSDDITSSYSQNSFGKFTNKTEADGFTYLYSTDAGKVKQSYTALGYSMNLDADYKWTSTDKVSNSNDGPITTTIVEKTSSTINSYAFSDSVAGFSIKASGTSEHIIVSNVDPVYSHTDTMSFKNVQWNEGSFKMTTAKVGPFTVADTLINFGTDQNADITDITNNLRENLLPRILAENNLVTLTAPIEFNAMAGDDKVTGSRYADTIYGGSGNDILNGGLGNDILNGGTGADKLSGGSGRDAFVFTKGDTDWLYDLYGTPTTPVPDQIMDFSKGSVGKGDLIQVRNELLQTLSLTQGGLKDLAATTDLAAINSNTGIAKFATGSGKTMSDAVSDIARSFSADTDAAGEFAFFKVNGRGNYNLFVSDGEAGVTSGDVVVQLVGVTSINAIDINAYGLSILG